MNEQEVPYTRDRSASRSRFLARFHRYRVLFLKKWWVLPLGSAAGLAAMLVASRVQVPTFTSSGRMIVSIKLTIPDGFDRMLQYVSGMENIRDVIPFPRTPRHADF